MRDDIILISFRGDRFLIGKLGMMELANVGKEFGFDDLIRFSD